MPISKQKYNCNDDRKDIYISSDCLKSFLTCGLYRYAKKIKMQKAGKPEKETFSGN